MNLEGAAASENASLKTNAEPVQSSIPRSSERIEANVLSEKRANQLKESIEILSQSHQIYINELKDQSNPPNCDRLSSILKELKAGLGDINSQYERLTSDARPNHDIVKDVDRLTQDNRNLVEMAESKISVLSARNKTGFQAVTDNSELVGSNHHKEDGKSIDDHSMSVNSGVESDSTLKPSQHSHKAPSSRSSGHSLPSNRSSQSGRSNTSSLLRLKAVAAAATAAEIKAKLDAEIIAQRLEEENQQSQFQIQRRNKMIAQNKMRAEIEAEMKKQQIYQQAILEEDDNTEERLMRPPSEINKSRGSYQRIQETPRVINISSNESPVTQASIVSEVSETVAKTMAQSLLEAMSLSRLPPPEPTVFHGDPLQYADWKVAFSGLIGNKPCSSLEKLHLLKRYVAGEARESIGGYFQLQSANAYSEALATLEREFGNEEAIEDRFRDRLEQWPKIAGEDSHSLKLYGYFLNQCTSAMACIPGLRVLNDKRENKKFIRALPDWLSTRWIRQVTKAKEQSGCFPKFNKYAEFVNHEVKVACSTLHEVQLDSQQRLKTNKGAQQEKRPMQIQSLKTESQTQQNDRKLSCLYCKRDNHVTANCFFLAKLSNQDKQDFMSDNSLCYACMEPGHSYNKCTSKAICRTCKKTHPTVMHDKYEEHDKKPKSPAKENQGSNNRDKPKSENKNDNDHVSNVNTTNSSDQTHVMSMTIPVWVSSKTNPNHEELVYALLDSGSDTSFISHQLLTKLKTKNELTTLNLTTMTSNNKTVQSSKVSNLQVRGYKGNVTLNLPAVYSQETIPMDRGQIPSARDVRDWPHLQRIQHELIPAGQNLHIGLLIGFNVSQAFLPREVIAGADHEPFAQRTDLGWCVVGQTTHKGLCNKVILNKQVSNPTNKDVVSFCCNTGKFDKTSERILQTLQTDFIDSGIDTGTSAVSVEDRKFTAILQNGITKDAEGYITMPLPFRCMPTSNYSRSMAENRFRLLLNKFKKDANYEEDYRGFMQQVLVNGDAEEVPSSELAIKDSWYIPHFGVYHPKKPGKIRVVFDCSSKTGGRSLNDHLLSGPDYMNSLIGILLRFRKERVAIACDIERMFHQFRVSENHRNYLRFLWLDENGIVTTYRMKAHLFGATSSPACATYGLRTLCQMSTDQSAEKAKTFINQNFYVDDGLMSVASTTEAKDLVNESINICKGGNLRLHKFISNSQALLESLPESERSVKDVHSLDLDNDSNPIERTLGINWNIKLDCFEFDVNPKNNPMTRRGILSTVASIYDPLGFISPVVLEGKQILQEMCRRNKKWDDPLCEDLCQQWFKWTNELPKLSHLQITRCYKPPDFGEITKSEIHNFADASTAGYGATCYLRLVNARGQAHCTLLISKARVTPLKAITIPRLELQAAVTSVSISQKVLKELQMDVSETFWTDSQVVLGYIKNSARKFHVYVANRVQQIRDVSQPEQWNYVPTSLNPADHASRGLKPNHLNDSNWFTGPEFLWTEPIQMPDQPEPVLRLEDPEVKHFTFRVSKTYPSFAQRMERFSNWNTMVKVAKVFNNKVNSLKKRVVDDITIHKEAVNQIIKSVQTDYFEEMEHLKMQKGIPPNSVIYKLNPFLDAKGIMRVGGRLQYCTSLEYEERYPAILPKRNHITNLIISHFHQKAAHQGRESTLSKIRASGYWIINARSCVSSLIYKCVTCKKLRAVPKVPQMADLPESRVTPQPPFTSCGVDCFGPFLVKERRSEIKRYGLMVTCLASRAVHIELLDDLSSTAFINGIRNVIAIRGPIREIRCDRGTNFIGAITELAQKNQMEFKLNPPNASHMGGVWERMIRSARNILKGMGRSYGGRIDTSGLRTLFYEVMAIINSRPLSTVTEEQMPLTPNMILTMKSDIIIPPPGKFEEADIYSRKRWRAVQHISNVFWNRWKHQYLAELQPRQKWVKDSPNIEVGSIVIVNEDDMLRNKWQLAKVVECVKSRDDRVRSVKLLLGNDKAPTNSDRYLVRPVSKIVVLVKSNNTNSAS